jgi:uncharacterized protein YecE (DUF72 family)
MWAHTAWQGRFLPPDLTRREQLPAYASWCTAVEGNTTFYGVPSTATIERWAAEAPEHFRFVFKLPRTITHELRLRDCTTEVRGFLAAVEPLGARAETLAIQLPASFGPGEIDSLERFLRRLPATHRYGVEVRHPDFFVGDGPARRSLERVLLDHGTEWIGFDTTTLFSAPPTSDAERDGWDKKPRLPRRTEALTDQPIVRYVGRDDVDATVGGWQLWVPILADWVREGRTPTFFLHTPDNDESLGLTRQLHNQVRALVPELAPLPTPMATGPTTLF